MILKKPETQREVSSDPICFDPAIKELLLNKDLPLPLFRGP